MVSLKTQKERKRIEQVRQAQPKGPSM